VKRLVLTLVLVLAAGSLRADSGSIERLSLSAPLMPDMVVFQYRGGSGYPATVEEVRTLVRESVMSFGRLFESCAPLYPGIVVPAAGEVLTETQIGVNYGLIARCAYEQFGAKPYWIPQLFEDVDVCAEVLGAGWRLPTEDDLRSYTTDEIALLEQALGTSATVSGWELAGLYYSKSLLVRGSDGRLALGLLAATAPERIRPLPIAPERFRELDMSYAADGELLSVRCFRRDVVVQ
jgi:hypothetical protein